MISAPDSDQVGDALLFPLVTSHSTAEGYAKAHEAEQKRILGDAFAHAIGVRAAKADTGK